MESLESVAEACISPFFFLSFEVELPKETLAVFVLPTYEEGTPTPDAKAFCDFVTDASQDFRVGAAYLSRLQYAVFSLGDSVYGENFCTAGRLLDEQLKRLGATRILARGVGDAQYT